MKCPNCGGNLKNDTHECPYCSSGFSETEYEQLKHNVKGTYEVKKGSAYKNDLLKAGETHLELGNFGDAVDFFEQVSREFPSDFRGWFGMVKGYTHNFARYQINLEQLQKFVDNAIKVGNDLDRRTVNDLWSNYLENRHRQMEEEQRRIKEKAEKARREAEEAEAKRKAAIEEAEAKRKAEAEEKERRERQRLERERLEKQLAERRSMIRRFVCTAIIIILQIVFIILMNVYDFVALINESAGGYFITNVAILADYGISCIISCIGKFRQLSYISVLVGGVFSLIIFINAMSSLEGIAAFLGFFFFGAIQLGVIYAGAALSKFINENQ